MLTREEQLLDAAVEVLADGGIRRLTHRAVDLAAGLPLGSTSNRFRTRDALLVAVLRRILARETETWTRLAGDIRTGSIEAFAQVTGRLLEEVSGRERQLSQARRALFIEASLHPVLRQEIAEAQEGIVAWMGPLLVELGSSDPSSHVHHLLALMDGLIGHQLVNPTAEFHPTAAVAALLHGLIDR